MLLHNLEQRYQGMALSAAGVNGWVRVQRHRRFEISEEWSWWR